MESKGFLAIYSCSFIEAKRLNELDRWKESHKENVSCKNAIEETIHCNFDGMYLQKDCAEDVIRKFGYERVSYVLANSLQCKDYDGRFSLDNHDWAKKISIASDQSSYSNRNLVFAVDRHLVVLDGFINQHRIAVQKIET